MLTANNEQKIYYTLRTVIAMCFIGHGAFGIITKPIWYHYFAVFGISESTASHLMPIIGIWDILLGVTMLVYPMPAIALFLVFWGTFTALLRPLSGEPFAEFIEHAGNYLAPLAFLVVISGSLLKPKQLFTSIDPDIRLNEKAIARLITTLRVAGFLLLVGHGWLNLIDKKALIDEYISFGIYNPVNMAHVIGVGEMTAGFLVLIFPLRPLIFMFLLWKVMSEFFYPHYELFEWVERGGSYGILLALWFALKDTGATIKRNFIESVDYNFL